MAGWVGSSFEIDALIGEAIGDHHGLSVALYHSNPGESEKLIGRVGAAPAGAFTRETTIQIDGTWRAVVRGSAPASGLSANLQGLFLFLVGAIVSLLLFALVLVLTRSRERALGMVQEKTGELRHQSLHDALTGLPNRVLALDRAEQMLARARRQQIPVAALYLDIDGFKHVNDTFGHAAGDELLRTVAARLEGVVREGDTAARLSGDEFVVLVEGSALDAGPELVAERLLEVLRRPYEMDGQIGRQLSLTASIGIALGERANAAELLSDADIALYEAKAAGKNRYMLFQSSMQTAAQDRLTLEMDLAEALEQHQLFLQYQPTFDLQSERVIGVEALIRWNHPTRGVIAPIEFIPIAEESGLIVPIGRWVLQEACRQAALWYGDGHRIGMAVNVSGRQLDDDELIEDVRGALQESGLDPTTLTLEITETTLMRDAEATAKRLRIAQAARGPHRDRRLRHRLQLARLPAPVPRRRTEDRPLLHQRHRRIEGLGSADPHARAARQDARHRDTRRGHRGAIPARDPATRTLRPRPGLPILAPPRRRRSRGVPQRRRVNDTVLDAQLASSSSVVGGNRLWSPNVGTMSSHSS